MSSSAMKELRQKEAKELELDLANFKKELFDLRFQSTTDKLANPARISHLRKDIARVRTLLREQEIAAAKAAGADA